MDQEKKNVEMEGKSLEMVKGDKDMEKVQCGIKRSKERKN